MWTGKNAIEAIVGYNRSCEEHKEVLRLDYLVHCIGYQVNLRVCRDGKYVSIHIASSTDIHMNTAVCRCSDKYHSQYSNCITWRKMH